MSFKEYLPELLFLAGLFLIAGAISYYTTIPIYRYDYPNLSAYYDSFNWSNFTGF